MAVAHDASFESAVEFSVSSFNWTHTPSGTPKGVIVFVFHANNTGDNVTSVTYGGTTVPEVTDCEAVTTGANPGREQTFFLGSSVPTGAQSVVVNRTNNTDRMYAVSVTVTSDGNTQVHEAGIVLLQGAGTISEQSVTDGSPGTNSVRYAGAYSASTTPPAAGSNSTLLFNEQITPGDVSAVVVSETTAGQGSRSVGFTDGSSNERAAAHFAVIEIASAVQTLAPSADSVDGNWTDQAAGTALAAAIDETTPSDTDYIQSESNPNNSASRVKLAAGGDPASSAGHEINWRISKEATGGQTINMVVKLYQGGGNSVGGGTLVAEFTRSNVTETWTSFAEPLSGGQADSITNYGDLYLEFWADV